MECGKDCMEFKFNGMLIKCSILRETSIDGTGWSPARRLKVSGGSVCVCVFVRVARVEGEAMTMYSTV